MKRLIKRSPALAAINRREWLALSGSALLAGCGGGGGLVAALPGTGGTGSPVYAQGSINGFGSVIINGVTFDDSAATISVDGVQRASGDLRLGMVAGIQATRDASTSALSAQNIEVWSIALGQVDDVNQADFDVAGMPITTDGGTSFDGLAASTDLRPGDWVQVWGLPTGAKSEHWLATRVLRLSAAADTTVSTGLLKDSHGSLKVNDMQIDWAEGVAPPNPGQVLRVSGQRLGQRLLQASWRTSGLSVPTHTEGEIEFEGHVTAVSSASRFTLGAVEVDASRASWTPAAATPSVGQRIEVYGSWQAGVLVANLVEFEGESQRSGAQILGRVEAYVSLADFTVRGQRCDASAAVFPHGRSADLRLGARVQLSGTKSGERLLISKVEFKD